MCGRKMFFGLAVACFLGVVLIGLSLSQAQPPQRPPGPQGPPGERMRGRFDPNQMPRDPEQMQSMMNERQIGRIKEALQPSAEEWKVLEPKVTKVLTLTRQTGGMGMGMGRRAGGQGNLPEFPRDESQIGKSTEELRKVLDNKDAKSDEIKAKLTALREAREKAKQELAKAQQELRGGLNVRQEAQLVLMGLLD
jgi:hypothetical protein